MHRLAPLAVCLMLAACKKTPAAPQRYCPQDLSGVWLNSSDKHFAYRFRDHGDVLRGEYLERSDDGTLKNPPDPVLFELHRTPTALAGVMKLEEALESGRKCAVEFGIRVSACGPDSLQAVVEMSAEFNDDCSRKPGEPQLVEYHFERDHPSVGRAAAH